MNRATFLVSYQFLREALHLPRSAELTYVEAADGQHAKFVVEHPDLPDDHGAEKMTDLPVCSPTFERREPVAFLGWDVRKEP